MKFGRSLQQSLYEPWREYYINYKKLKTLLREDGTSQDDKDRPWTDEDEQRFVDELVNVQLEKINGFQVETHKTLKERTGQCETKLERYVASKEAGERGEKGQDEKKKFEFFSGISKELDGIREEITRLERFSRINFTGALKAAKKHDRRRGTNYKVRPLLQVRLASLPFNSEDYSPLLYRLSAMYSFIRENLGEEFDRTVSNVEHPAKPGVYTSHKCKPGPVLFCLRLT